MAKEIKEVSKTISVTGYEYKGIVYKTRSEAESVRDEEENEKNYEENLTMANDAIKWMIDHIRNTKPQKDAIPVVDGEIVDISYEDRKNSREQFISIESCCYDLCVYTEDIVYDLESRPHDRQKVIEKEKKNFVKEFGEIKWFIPAPKKSRNKDVI